MFNSICMFHVGLTVELIHPTHLSPLNLCVKSLCIYVLHSRLPRLNAVPRNVSSPATVLHSSPDVSARAIFTLFTLHVHHSSVSYWHVLPHLSKNPFWCQLSLYPMNTRIVDGDARGLSIHTLTQKKTHKCYPESQDEHMCMFSVCVFARIIHSMHPSFYLLIFVNHM